MTRPIRARWLAVPFVLAAVMSWTSHAAPTMAQDAAPALRWFKGNTHTHTLNSDGDSTPDDVVRWYREHGYHFLSLTDHNFLTETEALNALHGASEKFVVIRGEEVTSQFQGKPLHVNGLNVRERVLPQRGNSLVETLQQNVDAIRRASGVPHINHPNFGWAITAEELGAVRNNKLFEIYNGHPQINYLGGGGVPGLEAAWDAILSAGTLLYGVAVDDAHVFKQPGNPNVAGPGRGWVMVRAGKLDAESVLGALERGDFYASTGVELSDYQVGPTSMTVTVRQSKSSKYRIQFVGRNSRILQESIESPATYRFTGGEGFVRARVLESNGQIAWGQPVFVK